MENSIGERVKSLRIERGMTLVELGEQVNLSASYLSQIERDRLTPSLTTLMEIAEALDVEPRYFFDSGGDSPLVRRAGQDIRPNLSRRGMVCYALSAEDVHNTLHVYRVELQPHHGTHEFEPYAGEEMCFVLSGELTVKVGEEIHSLSVGDSIHYDALLAHGWLCEGEQPCVFIWSRASYP
jgi:transcriptional regulator with XRE-family HTH domain